MKYFISIFLLVCFSSCTQFKTIPINNMKVIMWDMACADEWYVEKYSRDSTLKKNKENIRLYEQVFATHKISKEQFYSSYKYYQEHADLYKILIDSVQFYASRERNKPIKFAPTSPVAY